jgi:hypothetical protein
MDGERCAMDHTNVDGYLTPMHRSYDVAQYGSNWSAAEQEQAFYTLNKAYNQKQNTLLMGCNATGNS